MQTTQVSQITVEPHTAHLGRSHYIGFQPPVISQHHLQRTRRKVEAATGYLSASERTQKATIVQQSLELGLLSKTKLRQGFNRIKQGIATERKILDSLISVCETNIQKKSDKNGAICLDIEQDAFSVGYEDVYCIRIDTTGLTLKERAMIYIALEYVSENIIPMTTPFDLVLYRNHILDEIPIDDIIEKASTMDNEAFEHFLATNDDIDDMLQLVSGYSGGINVNEVFLNALGYQSITQDAKQLLEIAKHYHWANGDYGIPVGIPVELESVDNPVAQCLIHFRDYPKTEMFFADNQMMDSYPLNNGIFIIDAHYEVIMSQFIDDIYNEMMSVGEPVHAYLEPTAENLEAIKAMGMAFDKLFETNMESVE